MKQVNYNQPEGRRFRGRRFVIGLAMCLFGLFAFGGFVHAEPLFDEIDAYIERQLEIDRIPGLSLGIVRGSEVVHMRGFGVAGPSGTPVTPETSFVLGSMSKSFTALSIMQLVDNKRIELDDPVAEYIPWFWPQITIRHLLNHTSGLPSLSPNRGDPDMTLQEYVKVFEGQRLLQEPGSRYAYSSANYQVLGRVVEVVAGRPYGEYLQENVLSPHSMENTFVSQQTAEEETFADGYRYWFGYPVAADLSYQSVRLPTATLISSARDMTNYLSRFLNHGNAGPPDLLSNAGWTELLRPAAEGNGFSYAMGWRVGPIHGAHAIHHGGQVASFRGKIILLPEVGWGVIVLTNASSQLGSPSSHRIADDVAGILIGERPDTSGSSLRRLSTLMSVGILVLLAIHLKDVITIRRHLTLQSAGADIVIPIVLLVGLPRVFRLSWVELLRHVPDLGYSVLVIALTGLVVGLVKLRFALASSQA